MATMTLKETGAIGLILAALLLVAAADFEDKIFDTIGGAAKEGFKAATGAEMCTDGEHLGRLTPFCPVPGSDSSFRYCCSPPIGEPGCCNWFGKYQLYFLIGGGVLAVLLIAACGCCCYCCCCRNKKQDGAVIVMQSHPPPASYPNHRHQILQEDSLNI